MNILKKLFGIKKDNNDVVKYFDTALSFGNNPETKISFMESLEKDGIKLNDSEYAEVIDMILGKKYQEQNRYDITLSTGKIIKTDALQKALEVARINIIGSAQNEVTVRTPVPVALLYRAKSVAECPSWFLEMAYIYDLPIILK